MWFPPIFLGIAGPLGFHIRRPVSRSNFCFLGRDSRNPTPCFVRRPPPPPPNISSYRGAPTEYGEILPLTFYAFFPSNCSYGRPQFLPSSPSFRLQFYLLLPWAVLLNTAPLFSIPFFVSNCSYGGAPLLTFIAHFVDSSSFYCCLGPGGGGGF